MDMRPQKTAHNGPADVDESTDTYDTIDWLVKNVPNNNGKVGMWGISYPGFYTAAGIINAHPALVAASPQAPITDWFHGRRLSSQRRTLPSARISLLLRLRTAAARTHSCAAQKAR